MQNFTPEQPKKLTPDQEAFLAVIRAYGDPARYEDMVQTVLRGRADVAIADIRGALVHHQRADLYMLAAFDEERLDDLVGMIPLGSTDILMRVGCSAETVERVRTHFGLKHALPLVPYAYYGELPPPEEGADIRPLGLETLDFIHANYGHASREYLEARILDGVMIGIYVNGSLAAFIGEHIEGSMGLLHVMPDYRRHHMGYTLERSNIRRTMLAGQTPFAQVVPDNAASHALQTRLGATRGEGLLYWLTDDQF